MGGYGFEDYRKATERANSVMWAEQLNKRRMDEFFAALESWKMNTVVAQTKMARDNGVPMPPRPAVPTIQSIDMPKFDLWWSAVHHRGEMRDKDYYVETPMQLSEGIWELIPPNAQPPTKPSRPVGAKDPGMGRGWFQDQGGSAYSVGAHWVDPDTDLEYILYQLRESPFNPGVKPLRWGLVGIATPPA